ncbi:MAG: DUF3048 domain-containing protein [Eubacterium sp.]|nr:DUF3048 domain-containing protein [Eubacterium sp.]
MKKLFLLIICAFCLAGVSACGQEEETKEPVTTEEPAVEVAEEEVVVEEPKFYSLLTNLECAEETLSERPLAIMVPNDNYGAIPQIGISHAGVIYEVPVEGYYTRLMCIFDMEDYKALEKIGPVRSCRLYFAYFATGFDAIYVHYGEAKYAVDFLNSGKIDNLDGLNGTINSLVFTRDSSRKSPNNAFVSGESILAGIEEKGYSTEYEDADSVSYFNFAIEEITPSEGEATYVAPGFPVNKPYFEYDESTGEYLRYQYGDAHQDGESGEQLSFKNIIIQSTSCTTLDDKGRLEIETSAGGDGYYISNGGYEKITWKRDSIYEPVRYYNESGEEISINSGKTFICVVKNGDFDDVEIK